jgi:hypothetical protein
MLPDAARFREKSVPRLQSSLQKRLAQWRREIVAARIKLASDTLTAEQQRDLWLTIDCQEWFIKITAQDFGAQLEQIDREIETELRRPTA